MYLAGRSVEPLTPEEARAQWDRVVFGSLCAEREWLAGMREVCPDEIDEINRRSDALTVAIDSMALRMHGGIGVE